MAGRNEKEEREKRRKIQEVEGKLINMVLKPWWTDKVDGCIVDFACGAGLVRRSFGGG